jgi:16S rRNA (guanine527-N7)-methyltransferase
VDTRHQLVSRILDRDDSAVRSVSSWLDDVVRWNARIDLTAARNDEELVDLMVADAAFLSAHLGGARRLVDVGSGAGAPGLPLALLCPGLDVTLVEPMQKRTTLLRMCIGKLGLAERARVERLRGDEIRGRFDVAISRATLSPPEWLALGTKLAEEVWVLLARVEAPSIDGWAVADDLHYRWPLTGAERRAVRYTMTRDAER